MGAVELNCNSLAVCTVDGQFIIVISRSLTLPALNLSSLYVKDGQEAECRPKITTAQLVIFRFPITSCGSTKRVSIDGWSILHLNEAAPY